MQEYLLKASSEDANMRLDLFIINFSKQQDLGLSRTFVQKLIRDKKVWFNDACLAKSNHKVKPGDEIKIFFEKKNASRII